MRAPAAGRGNRCAPDAGAARGNHVAGSMSRLCCRRISISCFLNFYQTDQMSNTQDNNPFSPEMQQAGKQQMNIELDEEMAEGVYSNLVMIAHSPEEFILDFIRVMPGGPKARVKSRVIVTPQHAKRLMHALKDNIERFERAHGEIVERTPADQTIQFGGMGEA